MGAGELTRGLEKRSDHQATKERRPYKMWKLGLLSMVGKVLGRSIIKRMRDEVNSLYVDAPEVQLRTWADLPSGHCLRKE